MNGNTGKKRTAESKLKMRLARLGVSPWNKGKKTGQKVWNKGKKGLQVSWNKGGTVSQDTREKIRKTLTGTISPLRGKKRPDITGEKNSNWKGGITPINRSIRTSMEYKWWRISVFERDNYTCVWCGARSGNGKKVVLNADHIKPFALYPELRFAIDNGRTLCTPCHLSTDTYGSKCKKNHAG